MRAFRALALAALALTFVVVVVGAYVRLSHSGLGCPDWPGCYGQATPTHAAAHIAQAVAAQGGEHGPVSTAKAWKEMGHRYLAGMLGILIVLLAVFGLKNRRSPALAVAAVALVLFQATLGMWTVTMLLKPAIVTAHLLGGMTILAVLVWLALSQWTHRVDTEVRAVRGMAAAALAAVCLQIALGGWVSANYAALACPDLPGCLGQAVPSMDFGNAFHVLRELGQTADGDLLSQEALTAIHWTHRMFALVVVAIVAIAAVHAYRVPALRPIAFAVGSVLMLQFGLGVANVAFSLPLPLAAAHNAGAALLLAALVVLNFFAFRGLRPFK
jgi:cytochrome c oxidase assembly protein subunit 15